MLTWLKTLFGAFDRQQVAADRAAKALEDIAGTLEGVRDQLHARLGIEAPVPVPVVAEPLAVTAHDTPAEPAKPAAKPGRARN